MRYRRLLVPGLLGLFLLTPGAALACDSYYQSPASDYKIFWAIVALIAQSGLIVIGFRIANCRWKSRAYRIRHRKADIWQQLEQVANRWTVLYVSQHYLYRSRYDIDRYLLECGCDPAELELIWGVVLGSHSAPKPVKPALPAPVVALAPLTPGQIRRGKIALVLVVGMFILNVWLLISPPAATPGFTPVKLIPSGPPFSKQELLERNQQKWQNHNIKHYRITVKVTGLNSTVVITNTVNGSTVSQDSSICCDSYYKRYTVDHMFDNYSSHFVSHSRQALAVEQDAAATTIIYDNSYGYPKMFSYNPGRVNSKYDEWYEKIEVLSFEVLE